MQVKNGAGESEQELRSGDHWGNLIVGLLLVVFFVLVVVVYGIVNGRSDWFPVAMFFSVPIMLVPVLFWKLRRDGLALGFTGVTLSLCAMVLLVSWLLLSIQGGDEKKQILELVLWLASALIGFVLLICGFVTRRLLAPSSQEREGDGLDQLVELHPFYALVFFGVMFFVTLLAYSLVFAADDWLRRLKEQDPGLSRNLYYREVEGMVQDSSEEVMLASRASPHILEFPVGGESFHFDKEILRRPRQMAKEYETWGDGPSGSEEIRNTIALLAIVQEIESGMKTVGGVRVVMVGHADDRELQGRRYSSDYEISEARAQQVRLRIVQVMEAWFGSLATLDLDWEVLPLSNEPILLDGVGSGRGNNRARNESPFVEIAVIGHTGSQCFPLPTGRDGEPVQFGLLDYIYFSAYTLGTTGYGDLVPRSVFSKTAAATANVVELFFAVMFFNVILGRVAGCRRGVGKGG